MTIWYETVQRNPTREMSCGCHGGGRGVIVTESRSLRWNSCGKSLKFLQRCLRCKGVHCCSKQCQTKIGIDMNHFALENTQPAPVPPLTPHVSHLNQKQQQRLARLVGWRCLVDCRLNQQVVTSLWDIGVQVSVVPQRWLKENIPNQQLWNITELTPPN